MVLSHAIRVLRVWHRYRLCVRQLSALSDIELADIGVARSGIHWVAWRTSGDDDAGKPSDHASGIHER